MKHLIRIRAVCERTGLGRSTVHEHVTRGLLPPAIKISRSWGAWYDHEIDQIVSARIAGWGDDQLRALVRRLIADRKRIAPEGIAVEPRAAP